MAIGNFDGVHLGHQAVLAQAKGLAHSLNRPAVVLTFAPHPREYFRPELKPLRMDGWGVKMRLLEQAGMQAAYVLRFDAALAAMPAEDFIRNFLVEGLQARAVFTGENFHFGAKRQGDAALLNAQARHYGFSYRACEGVRDASGVIISSSRIRDALQAGEPQAASAMLGRPYAFEGRVQKGRQLGRKLGFPTANLAVKPVFLPKLGVYSCKVRLPSGEIVSAIANLGRKPTVTAENKVTLEVHLFDFSNDLYGQRLQVMPQRFLREERTFPTVESLKMQIEEDCAAAKGTV